MADQGREALELVIGAMLAQYAVCEFLIRQGIISEPSLRQFLDAKQSALEPYASKNAMFAYGTLRRLLQGQRIPGDPGETH